MSGQLHFRVATANDAEQIRQLIETAFRAEDSRQGWADDLGLGATFSMELETVLKITDNPGSAMLMACNDRGTLLGSVGVAVQEKRHGRIFLLSVEQGYQQGGLGRNILSYAEEYCQQRWSVAKIGLNAVSTRHKLIAWYMRHGYTKTGETSPFPRHEAPGLDLPDDLCFVEMEKTVGATS
jgi:ribosomal protein S18 acetylase RimI-like enzyme